MFTGEITGNISHSLNLQELDLGKNNLTGKLPAQLGSLEKLQNMVFQFNILEGEIPPSFGNLSSLLGLWGSSNTLSGEIPQDIGKLRSLSVIGLDENNLRGTVPSSIYNLSSLLIIGIANNQLAGTLPSNMGVTLPNLESVYIHDNHFIGKVPLSFSNLSSLWDLEIASNKFTGQMPTLERAQNLRNLQIDDNLLGNREDDDLIFLHPLANNTSLEILVLANNNMGGVLPETVSNFSKKLYWMGIRGNQIRGSIPAEIGNLDRLENLDLGTNILTGSIPTSIGKLVNLKNLFLDDNILSGSIPSSLTNVTLLLKVNMASNNLSGNIPLSFGNCHMLITLSLSQNSLSGPIPEPVLNGLSTLVVLYLDKNQLTGTIPSVIGQLMNLGYLDLSRNKLSGEIPGNLGTCIALEYLWLGENFFGGNIPSALSSLRGLQYWNLSHNNLSGNIPDYLTNLNLSVLDLSFNDFTGEVPLQGIFKNASAISVEGNTKLCGGIPALLLPKCTEEKPPTSRLSHISKIVIFIACAVFGVTLIASIIVAYSFRKKRQSPTSVALARIHFPQLSFEDLQKATKRFSSANLIGVGGFGSVYRGFLSDGTIVAVKVLNLLNQGADKSFASESKALANIRHRNLVRVLTVCSSIDFGGKDFKALVYEYMAHGSLECWLHPSQASDQAVQPKYLNLIQRLNISIDVASALEYLHNHCQPPLVHCDLKPSNVLLDGDSIAHVGDFGLARFLEEKSYNPLPSNPSSSIGMRGTIGYVAPGTKYDLSKVKLIDELFE